MGGSCSSILSLFRSQGSDPSQFIFPKWKSSDPLTREQLNRQRTAYWETCSVYGGSKEIWQALEAAVTESRQNPQLARMILQSANIRLANVRSLTLSYDELGCEYTIPDYCLADPTNLLTNVVENIEKCNAKNACPSDPKSLSSNSSMVHIRFSSHHSDTVLAITKDTTFKQLDHLLTIHLETSDSNRAANECSSMGAQSQFYYFHLGKGPFHPSDRVLARMKQSYPQPSRWRSQSRPCHSDNAILQVMMRPIS